MFDMMGMLGKVKKAQAAVKETKDKLESKQVEGESGAGMVKVTISGAKKLIRIDVDQSLINPNDPATMNDLIVAAVNNGLEKADDLMRSEMKAATDGLIPNIPGLDLGGMINV